MEQTTHRMDKAVVRVTVVRKEADGKRVAIPVYDETQALLGLPRKKQTGLYKVMEKRTRKSTTKGVRLLDTYLALHERSNHKKKNGWARDYFRNSLKAMRKTYFD